MGKDKTKNGNKSMDARIAFLQQAATYLTTQSHPRPHPNHEAHNISSIHEQEKEDSGRSHDPPKMPNGQAKLLSTPSKNTSRSDPPPSARLVSHLTLIAQKSQIRLLPSTKHQICKRCSTLLVEDSTCRRFGENLSKGGKKPHAEMQVVECSVCGAKKRWPIGARRQLRKGLRSSANGIPEHDTVVQGGEGRMEQGGFEK